MSAQNLVEAHFSESTSQSVQCTASATYTPVSLQLHASFSCPIIPLATLSPSPHYRAHSFPLPSQSLCLKFYPNHYLCDSCYPKSISQIFPCQYPLIRIEFRHFHPKLKLFLILPESCGFSPNKCRGFNPFS